MFLMRDATTAAAHLFSLVGSILFGQVPSGLEIATNMVANATSLFSLATKIVV